MKNKIILSLIVISFLFFGNYKVVKADECGDCKADYAESWCIQEGFCAGDSNFVGPVEQVDTGGWSQTECLKDDPNAEWIDGSCKCKAGFQPDANTGLCLYRQDNCNDGYHLSGGVCVDDITGCTYEQKLVNGKCVDDDESSVDCPVGSYHLQGMDPNKCYDQFGREVSDSSKSSGICEAKCTLGVISFFDSQTGTCRDCMQEGDSLSEKQIDKIIADRQCVAQQGVGYTSDGNGGCIGTNGAQCSTSNDTCTSGCTCKETVAGSGIGTCQVSIWGRVSGGCKSTPITQTPEEIAAAERRRQEANLRANTAGANQQAAANNMNQANERVRTSCTNQSSPECVAARRAADQAQQQLVQVNAELASAQAEALAAQQALAGAQSGGGGNLNMVANGINGPVVDQGLMVGGYGGYGGNTGLPGYYGGGTGGTPTPKCGQNFSEIGGVCFPTNTGLSSAPIYVILSNLFSWLMGIFTTLAVVAFVVSGVQYLMSSGDEELAKSAKKNAINAIFGIIIGLSGFIIIKAIAAALAGQGYFF